MTAERRPDRRKSFVVAALLLAAAGLLAYRGMPRRLEPTVDVARAVVEARLPGVSARELEAVLTDRIEDALLELPAVLSTDARTRDGASVVLVELPRAGAAERETVLSAIGHRLERLREELAGTFVGLEGPHLRRLDDPLPEALVVVAATAGGAAPVLAAERLAERLRRLEEVSAVTLAGRPTEAVRLFYDDALLVDAGITPLVLRDLLRAHHFTAPGAYWSEEGAIVPLEARSRLEGVEALQALEVRDPADGDAVQLARLVDVERGPVTPAFEEVLSDGRPAVALAVTRAAGVDLAAFGRGVRAEVDASGASTADAPRGEDGVRAEAFVLQSDVVGEKVQGFERSLAQSFAAIFVLLLLFLGPRTGTVVALMVPVVVLTSIGLLSLGGVALDVVSLSSFVLVLGLLVDNHVVMAERVQRLGEGGATPLEAVRRALAALKGPLVAASATTALGFLPVVRTDDVIGDYVRSLFWVVLVTLAVSLVFSFAVTPLLVRGVPREGRPEGVLTRAYRRVLTRSVRAPVVAVFVLLALCLGGWRAFESAEQIFFPASARPLWTLEVELPAGATLERTRARVASLEERLAREASSEDGALEGWVTFLGRSAPRFQTSLPAVHHAPHYAQLLLRLDEEADVASLERGLREWIAAASTPANGDAADGPVRARLRPVRLGAELEWPVEIDVHGPDEEVVARAAAAVAERITAAGGTDVHDDRGEPIRKRRVVLDRAALAEKGATAADVTVGIHAAVHGVPVFEVEDGRGGRLPVLLRARTQREDREEALQDAYVYPAKGEPSLLYEVASIEETREPPVRRRKDGRPAIAVRADAPSEGAGLRLEHDVAAGLREIEAANPGVTAEPRGLFASASRANRALLEEVPVALLLVLLFLVLQSRSLRETLLTLLTIPMAFAGVAFGLKVTGEPFSFMTLVGMTALAGIVVNNAIVLLSSTRVRLAERAPDEVPRDALVEACVERLRPILLTTACALASMIVLHRSGGPMWQPLATATISGLVVSTGAVLLLLPSLAALLFRVRGGTAERVEGAPASG